MDSLSKMPSRNLAAGRVFRTTLTNDEDHPEERNWIMLTKDVVPMFVEDDEFKKHYNSRIRKNVRLCVSIHGYVGCEVLDGNEFGKLDGNESTIPLTDAQFDEKFKVPHIVHEEEPFLSPPLAGTADDFIFNDVKYEMAFIATNTKPFDGRAVLSQAACKWLVQVAKD